MTTAMASQTGGMRTRLAAAVAVLALLLSACADDSAGPDAQDSSTDSGSTPSPTSATTTRASPEPSTATSTAPPAQPTEPGAVIAGSASDFGTILFDDTGQAIYLFDVETTSEAQCYDACAKAWPPVLTPSDPVAGEHVDATLLGTTQRDDGTTQVTYNGHPLYFYAHEDKHEVRCHDVFLNGGNWYAVQPDGRPAP